MFCKLYPTPFRVLVDLHQYYKKKGLKYMKKNNNVFNSGWEVEIEQVEKCSKAPKKIELYINNLANCKIYAMMDKYPNIEWLAYLLGKDNKITDIFIPNQKISQVSITNIKCDEYNDLPIIGVIHSHHGMGNGFSSTDDEWINANHDISICISNSGMNGQVRWKTPCGSIKIIKAKINNFDNKNFDKNKFIKSVEGKLSEEINYYQNFENRHNSIYNISNFNNIYVDEEEGNDVEKDITKELNFDEDQNKLYYDDFDDGEEDGCDDKLPISF